LPIERKKRQTRWEEQPGERPLPGGNTARRRSRALEEQPEVAKEKRRQRKRCWKGGRSQKMGESQSSKTLKRERFRRKKRASTPGGSHSAPPR